MLLASALWTAGADAQSMSANRVYGRYQQALWQERDGLPQNTVLAITKTRDGYLWLGTYEGAARFDGVRFTLFNANNTAGLGNSFVTALHERRNGELWLATWGGGISRLSGGRFTQFTSRDGLSSDYTGCLFEDRAGTLWIGTEGGGATALRDGRFSAYTVADGLPHGVVRGFADDGPGSVLVGTSRGIARITNGRVTPYAGPAELAHVDIRTMKRFADGSLWVALMRGSLFRLDSHGVTRFGPTHGLTTDGVESLFEDKDGLIWVGTSHGGLFRYSAGRFEHYGPEDGLPGGRVASVAQDADEGLWIGTDAGLVRLTRPRFTVYTTRHGLTGDVIGNILQDAAGNIWVVSSGKLSRFAHGTFNVIAATDGLSDDRIRGLARSADGAAWVYSRSTLARWQRDRFVEDADGNGLPWDRVHSLLRDRHGTLWLGILEDGGLIRVRNGHRTHLTKKDGLADDSVLALFEDRSGNVWVGTLRSGITRISGGQMTSWSTEHGLAANHVKAFYQDAAGALWIGTHGGGLSRFKDGKFASISMRQGLYKDDIFQILEDDEANLWMNCNSGIWRTSLTQLNEVADGKRTTVESFGYTTADGMLSSQATGSAIAGWKMHDGSLWFPTTRGVVVIDPRQRDTEPPRVLIEGAAIEREPVELGGPIHLTPGQQNLEIQYTGLSWSRPQSIKFKYLMSGIDRHWVDAGARRTAYYPYLPPGSYTFTVIADNGEGVWNEAGQSLAVTVLPPFYQTWWFRSATAATAMTMLWLFWRYRIAQIERARAAQQAFSRELIESQERERQRIAAELHDSLGQNLLVVKNRALLGTLSEPGEQALKQFNEIGAAMAQTLEEVRTISYNLRPHHLDQLGLTTAIRAMIEKMAESSTTAIRSQVDDIDGIFAADNEITIYRIIQESLNNVLKHSHADRADVAVRCREHDVEIEVRDDGQGFVPWASADEAGRPGGFGLKGIAQRVHMLGGTHTIESTPGRGTTISVRIGVTAAIQRQQRDP
jgi:signal transduction histidine kinase/ligand-binding sensor domain-containing protein